MLVGNTKSVFSLKKVSQKFFLLKNMLKIAAFSLLANNFLAKISRGLLLDESVFPLSWKKVRDPRRLFLGHMNYKLAKIFFVFYENLQFPSSLPVLEGKFEIIWKNQKTTFLLKKIFFSSMRYSRGFRRSPWWRNNNFPSTHWQGNDKNADPLQSGLKIQVLLYKAFWPHFQDRKPRGCVNTHFLPILHHFSPKEWNRPKICTKNLLHKLCTYS